MNYVDLLKEAVSIPSFSKDEAAVSQFLTDWMQNNGFKAYIDAAGNAVGTRGTGSTTVVLLGHIDTAAGTVPVRTEGDLFYGRGSVDAKGSFCTFISAVAALPEEALQNTTFICVGAVEEEAPTSKGARYAMHQYQPDYVLIGEPSSWDAITLGYKGRLILKAELQKEDFHTAGDGTSASDDMVTFCQTIRNWAAEWATHKNATGIFNTIQVMVQSISGGSDGLWQTAKAVIGLRLPPELYPLDAKAQIEALKPEGLTLELIGEEIPYKGEKDNPLTRALRVAIRQAGGTPRFKVKTGTSDMNVVAPLWQVPMVAYGPGDSGLDHTPTEHISLTEYQKAIDILKNALCQLAGVKV